MSNSSSEDDRHKKTTRKRSTREYFSDSSDSDRRKKRHRKKDKKTTKKSNRRRDFNSDSDVSSSEEDNRHRKRHRKRRKSTDERCEEETKKKRKKEKKGIQGTAANDLPTYRPGVLPFGTFGILKAADYHKTQYQRSFEAWMGEIKAIPSFTGAKWELNQYFAEFMEDFNTCTFPHVKYFDYDKWEQEEYDRQKNKDQSVKSGSNSMLADEAQHREVMREKQQRLKRQEMQLLKQTMTSDKVQDMKHQQLLQSEMRHAYKTGDEETRQRLARKLEPTEER